MNLEIYLQIFKTSSCIFWQYIYIYIYIYIDRYILFTDILIKNGWKDTGVSTRSKGAIKFSGLPSPLDKTEPPTCGQIIQYSYFLMNTYAHLSCFGISKLIAKDVIDIWKAVNPRLSLLKEIGVVNKVKILYFQKAKQINRKHLPAAQTKFWTERLDTLFDISSCSCNLPILSCDNINVKYTKENGQTNHIICTCPLTKKPTKKYEDIPTNSFNIIWSGWFFPFLLIFFKWWNRGL